MAATLIIEDGTGTVENANSYVTVAEVTSFCTNYGLDSWLELENTAKITAILRGMAYVETFDFKGVKLKYTDPLEWPRYGVFDESYQGGSLADWSSEELAFYQEIPPAVKRAVCRAAYEESVSPGVLQPAGQSNIQSETIDVISVTYFKGVPALPVYPVIEGFLKGLLKSKNVAELRRC